MKYQINYNRALGMWEIAFCGITQKPIVYARYKTAMEFLGYLAVLAKDIAEYNVPVFELV